MLNQIFEVKPQQPINGFECLKDAIEYYKKNTFESDIGTLRCDGCGTYLSCCEVVALTQPTDAILKWASHKSIDYFFDVRNIAAQTNRNRCPNNSKYNFVHAICAFFNEYQRRLRSKEHIEYVNRKSEA